MLDTRMCVVVTAKYKLGLVDSVKELRLDPSGICYIGRFNVLVGSVYILNSEDSQVAVITRVTERELVSRLNVELVNLFLVDIESNWHAEKQTIG